LAGRFKAYPQKGMKRAAGSSIKSWELQEEFLKNRAKAFAF
jgi:hypothetical protein